MDIFKNIMNKFYNIVIYKIKDAIHVALEYKINKSKSYARPEELILWNS